MVGVWRHILDLWCVCVCVCVSFVGRRTTVTNVTSTVTVGQHKFFYVVMVFNNWLEYFLPLTPRHQPTSLAVQAVFVSTCYYHLSLSYVFQMASQLRLIGRETDIIVCRAAYRSE